jgi:hypothetical protein
MADSGRRKARNTDIQESAELLLRLQKPQVRVTDRHGLVERRPRDHLDDQRNRSAPLLGQNARVASLDAAAHLHKRQGARCANDLLRLG